MTKYMMGDEGPTATAEWIADLEDKVRELEEENKRLRAELASCKVTVLPEVSFEPA